MFWKVSNKGLSLLKKLEGWRNHPYLDSANVATIGYGNTFYMDGKRVTMLDEPITQAEGEKLLQSILGHFEKGVKEATMSVCLQPNQFDALVIFAYNVGIGAFKGSTLLKRVLANPDDEDIKTQFLRWNKAGGRVNKGLIKRRNQEIWLYFEHLR
jgi:lysozyme